MREPTNSMHEIIDALGAFKEKVNVMMTFYGNNWKVTLDYSETGNPLLSKNNTFSITLQGPTLEDTLRDAWNALEDVMKRTRKAIPPHALG